MLAVLLPTFALFSQAGASRLSLHNATLLADRPFTMRIASKYNEEHPECLIRSTTSNIPLDDGSDDPENIWAWSVGKTHILSNTFAGHWAFVFETYPSGLNTGLAPQEGKRFVVVQRVIDWDKAAKTTLMPCNNAEISIHTDEESAASTAGNHKMVNEKMVIEAGQDGSAYTLRDIAQYVGEVMESAHMAAPFSWSSSNCRDFVRQLSMSLGIVQSASGLWGLDELVNGRDYLDPELRKVCDEQTGEHKEPCFCKSQKSWNWLHSCRKSSRCTWNEESLQCHPKCAHADNQNALNCENAQWGGCVWSPAVQDFGLVGGRCFSR